MARLYIAEIRNALKDALKEDDKVILIGEDIQDPFGGCFKVTRGLSTEFPGRVINTPISEAAITGVATGLALRGYKPVVEIMFYDFMALTMDQILNHMMKFKQLWGIDLNITIRTAIGNPSYGATHCQNLDYLFKNVIDIVHPTLDDDVYASLKNAIRADRPVLFVEESGLYSQKLNEIKR